MIREKFEVEITRDSFSLNDPSKVSITISTNGYQSTSSPDITLEELVKVRDTINNFILDELQEEKTSSSIKLPLTKRVEDGSY